MPGNANRFSITITPVIISAKVRPITETSCGMVEALRAQMGLDRPLIVQYGAWIAGLVRGDFGTAMLTGQPVAALVGTRAAITFPLIILGLIIALACAVPPWPRGPAQSVRAVRVLVVMLLGDDRCIAEFSQRHQCLVHVHGEPAHASSR